MSRTRAGLIIAAVVTVCVPAGAWSQGMPGQDKSKPIEIIADTLVVDQDKDVATFTGDVEAVQGDMTMTSDLLRVFYVQAEDGAAAGGEDQSIRRIEAEGSVHLSSPSDTAEGDRGIYDVPEAKVRLDGNVILTRGDSVVKGDSLEMDLNTNVSTVRGKPDAAGRREQRVRALFVPAKKKEP